MSRWSAGAVEVREEQEQVTRLEEAAVLVEHTPSSAWSVLQLGLILSRWELPRLGPTQQMVLTATSAGSDPMTLMGVSLMAGPVALWLPSTRPPLLEAQLLRRAHLVMSSMSGVAAGQAHLVPQLVVAANQLILLASATLVV